MKIAGAMKSSTEVMKTMSNLIKLPELQRAMQEMSKEMMKAGIIDELIQDSIDSTLEDGEDIDTIADAEVEKIIFEITQGKLKDLPDVNKSLPASANKNEAAAASAYEDIDDEDPEEEISKRLEALRS